MEKRKLAAAGRIDQHHERKKETYKSNPDIDPSRSALNYHLVTPTASYRQMALDRIAAVGARRRKDSVVLQDGLVTASPEWLRGLTVDEQKQYFEHAFDFIRERYGADNIVSAVVHLDEATPHMHFVFVPITAKGRLSSKEVMGGPKGMVQLQDEFFAHMNARYPDLSRGTPKRVTHREHVPVYLFKNAAGLYSHYEEICGAIRDIGLIGNAKKKNEALALLGRYAPEMVRLAEQLKTTENHIRRLEGRVRSEQETTSYWHSRCAEKDQTIDKQNESLYALNRKQRELQRKIDLIPPDLLAQLEEEERRRRAKQRAVRGNR